MIKSRKDAMGTGEKRYFTGKPCPRGHIDCRLVSNGTCCQCNREKVGRWQAENPDKVRKNHREWVLRNPGLNEARRIKWYDENKTRSAETTKKYRESNPGLINTLSSKARAAKLQRIPHWLTEDDHWIMEQAYELAQTRTKMFGFPWHVDHVIPLRGRRVSGLHTPTNLQVIPAVENLKKGNSHG
jgi:hypothetical protein